MAYGTGPTHTVNNNGSVVGFKLGTQAALDAIESSKVQNGVFYLTSDTHRLYIGNSDQTISPVNEGVISVATIDDLPDISKNNHQQYQGQFYYITSGNILCVASGRSWVQINSNTNTTITDFNDFITISDSGVVTIKSALTESESGNLINSSGYTIEGENGIKLEVTEATVDGDENVTSPANLKISGDKYSLSAEAASNTATIKLDSANTDNDTQVSLQGGTNVAIEPVTAADGKVIPNMFKISSYGGLESVDGYYLNAGGQRVKVTKPATPTSGFEISTIEDNTGNELSAYLDPVIHYGQKNDQSLNNAKFINGQAVLDIYTAKEIDDILVGLNAMVYRGLINSQDEFNALKAEDKVSIGDSYILTASIVYNNGTTNAVIPTGALAIARSSTGQEEADGYIAAKNIIWDFVEGDSTDTQYSFDYSSGTDDSKGIALMDSLGSVKGTLKLKPGSLINVTRVDDGSDNSKILLSVDHAAITRTDVNNTGDAKAVKQSEFGSFNTGTNGVVSAEAGHFNIQVISQVTTDDYGHVTGVTLQEYQITDTISEIDNISITTKTNTAKTQADLTQSIVEKDTNGNEKTSKVDFSIKSTSLQVEATDAVAGVSNASINLNLIWGSF